MILCFFIVAFSLFFFFFPSLFSDERLIYIPAQPL